MQAESRTNLFDYAEAQLIFVQQRYNIGIAVVKYFGNYFSKFKKYFFSSYTLQLTVKLKRNCILQNLNLLYI